jgi:hypothetical protein
MHASWRAKQSLNLTIYYVQCEPQIEPWCFGHSLLFGESLETWSCLIEMITWSIWSVVANRTSKAMGMHHAGHLSIFLLGWMFSRWWCSFWPLCLSASIPYFHAHAEKKRGQGQAIIGRDSSDGGALAGSSDSIHWSMTINYQSWTAKGE